MEINIKEPAVPDFSQTFVKGAPHNFSLLLSDFMKKPSRYFAGKKSTGFIKYRSKILISNTETLMLTDPEPVQGGYRVKWASDMGKTGTCTMNIAADGTLWFTGLGTFDKSIGPDKLVFVRQPGQTTLPTDGPPAYKPETDADGNIMLPKASSGTLTGRWIGDGGLMIKFNSIIKSYRYSNATYHGFITMEGPGYVSEGIVAVVKHSDTCVGLYSIPLGTDVRQIHYSEIHIGPTGRASTYHLCGSVEVRSQSYKLMTNTAIYKLNPIDTRYYGMFSTGNEVRPVPLNFYFKQSYDDGYGNVKLGYGCITLSYNRGNYIDNDFIYDAQIQINGSVRIKYQCGRTDNKYSALLVWNKDRKSWTVTQIRRIEGSSDDCYMMNSPQITFKDDIM
ncbi:unknown [Prevotella sp. CAG:1185]|nr:unknown [Prevotella sp. CAG:1185]